MCALLSGRYIGTDCGGVGGGGDGGAWGGGSLANEGKKCFKISRMGSITSSLASVFAQVIR